METIRLQGESGIRLFDIKFRARGYEPVRDPPRSLMEVYGP